MINDYRIENSKVNVHNQTNPTLFLVYELYLYFEIHTIVARHLLNNLITLIQKRKG